MGHVARWLTASLGAAPLLLLALTADALTRDDDALGFERTPPRLRYADGEVTFFRAGSDDWTAAQVNTPLAPGDLLFAGESANLEIQIGTRAFVRGAEQTEIGLTAIEPDFLQLRVTSGTVALDLRSLSPGQTFEVDTPNAAFKIEDAGYYRLEVAGEVTAFTSRRGGLASATVATGDTVAVRANEQLAIQGTLTPQLQTAAAPELDAWDRWNYARSEPPSKAVSAQYVPSDVYGTEELDRYGDWRVEPSYGPVWYPRGVASSWVPYSTGSWLNDPYYGWSWVDTAPWGWAPYHYGRWVYTSGFWGWCPGPRVARAWYAPALVAFYDTPAYSVSYATPSVGWVALGYGEPLYPWWGSTAFRAVPHWAGWGGYRHDWDDDHDDDHHHGGGHGHGGHGHDGDWDDHDGKGGHGGKDWGHGDNGGHGGKDWGRGDNDWDRGEGRGRGSDDRGRDREGRGHEGGLHAYQNARVKGAIVSTDREQFGRRGERTSYRRASRDELAPLRGDGASLPERARRTADAHAARRSARHVERAVPTARREVTTEARRSAEPPRERSTDTAHERSTDASRERSPGQGFAPPARTGRATSDLRPDRPQRRAERDAGHERGRRQMRERQRPQPPQQTARSESDTRSRREERDAPRAERPREPSRTESSHTPRAERTREARASEPRRERVPDRQTARAEHPQTASRREVGGRGDGGGRSRGEDRGDRGDSGGRHGGGGGGRGGRH